MWLTCHYLTLNMVQKIVTLYIYCSNLLLFIHGDFYSVHDNSASISNTDEIQSLIPNHTEIFNHHLIPYVIDEMPYQTCGVSLLLYYCKLISIISYFLTLYFSFWIWLFLRCHHNIIKCTITYYVYITANVHWIFQALLRQKKVVKMDLYIGDYLTDNLLFLARKWNKASVKKHWNRIILVFVV